MELLGVVEHERRDLCDWLVMVGVRPEFRTKTLRQRSVVIDVPEGGQVHGKVMALVHRSNADSIPDRPSLAIVKGDWRSPIIGASVYLADRAEAVPA